MHLKELEDYCYFLKAVKVCKGDVLFKTAEGDCLNLKSALSEFVFITAVHNKTIMRSGSIFCQEPDDLALLSEYLEEDDYE